MKLIYFDMQGRAEFSRLLLAQAGVQYEDKRISQAEWEKLKPSKLQLTEGRHQCSWLQTIFTIEFVRWLVVSPPRIVSSSTNLIYKVMNNHPGFFHGHIKICMYNI